MNWMVEKKTPINHGKSSDLLKDAVKVIKEFVARDPKEMRFTITALAPTEAETLPGAYDSGSIGSGSGTGTGSGSGSGSGSSHSGSGEGGGEWQCAVCTLINTDKRTICETCGVGTRPW